MRACALLGACSLPAPRFQVDKRRKQAEAAAKAKVAAEEAQRALLRYQQADNALELGPGCSPHVGQDAIQPTASAAPQAASRPEVTTEASPAVQQQDTGARALNGVAQSSSDARGTPAPDQASQRTQLHPLLFQWPTIFVALCRMTSSTRVRSSSASDWST